MGLTIGDAATQSGLPAKTIRYYDEIALVSPSSRSEAGYRRYEAAEVRKLAFVKRARSFGFSVEDCRQLLGLFENQSRSSRDVKDLANRRLVEIEEKISDLQCLHDELSVLSNRCPGDEQSDCPILSSLAKNKDI